MLRGGTLGRAPGGDIGRSIEIEVTLPKINRKCRLLPEQGAGALIAIERRQRGPVDARHHRRNAPDRFSIGGFVGRGHP